MLTRDHYPDTLESSTSAVLIIHVIGPWKIFEINGRLSVTRLGIKNPNIWLIAPSYPRLKGYNRAILQVEWARPELNWRSSPCQGDVITPRPRALCILVRSFVFG